MKILFSSNGSSLVFRCDLISATSMILNPFATRKALNCQSFSNRPWLSKTAVMCLLGKKNRNSEIVGHIRFSFAVKPRVFSMFCWRREARCRAHNAERCHRALSHGRRSIAERLCGKGSIPR